MEAGRSLCASPRTAKPTQRNPVNNKQKKAATNKQKTKKTCSLATLLLQHQCVHSQHWLVLGSFLYLTSYWQVNSFQTAERLSGQCSKAQKSPALPNTYSYRGKDDSNPDHPTQHSLFLSEGCLKSLAQSCSSRPQVTHLWAPHFLFNNSSPFQCIWNLQVNHWKINKVNGISTLWRSVQQHGWKKDKSKALPAALLLPLCC